MVPLFCTVTVIFATSPGLSWFCEMVLVIFNDITPKIKELSLVCRNVRDSVPLMATIGGTKYPRYVVLLSVIVMFCAFVAPGSKLLTWREVLSRRWNPSKFWSQNRLRFSIG